MFRVDHASTAASLPAPSPISTPGYFTEGSEAGGVPATVITADWANMVQEELLNVVVAGGQMPAKNSFDQLLLAIQSLISQGQASSVGKVSLFAVKTPPAGWLKCNGLTIGKPGSGATARANADVFALYIALWIDWSNAILRIQTASGSPTVRGASAQADWDALKRLPLPEMRGEGLRVWDDGRGVDQSREFGSAQSGQIQSHEHSAQTGEGGAHTHTMSFKRDRSPIEDGNAVLGDEDYYGLQTHSTSEDGKHSHSVTVEATGGNETRMRNIALSAFICYR